ncbi:alkaline phosphatase family protein [Labedella phragmitis]|uniref:Alkaline phosphatase family protein n=2 Tax=Labedella phragmitis TaxID=2498849 RepID=A0A444PW68_9MICO|nr:alkaline phosphatase family protein [Labedella phragmitis]
MLPIVKPGAVSLADVLPDSVSALDGRRGRLGLPAARAVVVIVVDGLGAQALANRAGHARTLVAARARSIDSVVPSTTAAALTTILTGAWPGVHGLVGYRAIDRRNDRVVNQLSGWDDRMLPETWQRSPTVFEGIADGPVSAVAVGPTKFAGSGLTRAILRGAPYVGEDDVARRFAIAAERARAERTLTYVYVPELDKAGHKGGVESSEWMTALEYLDAEVAVLESAVPRRTGIMITADHGMLDIPHDSHVLLSQHTDVMAGVRHVAGEPRFLHLGLEHPDDAPNVVAAWEERFGDSSWITARDDAIAAGWFGTEVSVEARERMGDVLVAPRRRIAFYDDRHADDPGRGMVGQHGSLTPEERSVPVIRLGAWRR